LGVQIITFESPRQNRDTRRYLIRPTCQSPSVATGMNHRPVATMNLKRSTPLSRHLFEYSTDGSYKMMERRSFSLVQSITLSLSKLSLLQRIASNNNNIKHKLEEEVESLIVMKRVLLSDDDADNDDSSDSPEEEEVSSEETMMNQLNTSEEKLQVKRAHGIVFGNDGDTTSPSSEPRTPKVTCAPTGTAVKTMMMTTSGCRYKSRILSNSSS
jgi:hypothetical protein